MNSPMLQTKDFDPKVRTLVLYMDAEWTANKIAWLLKKPIRTIRDWISKIGNGIDIMKVQPGRGKKQIISEDVKRKVMRAAARKPVSSSLRNLGGAYNIRKDLAGKILKEKEYKYQNVQKEVKLTEKEKSDRMKFCRNMSKRKTEPIDENFFTYETGIGLFDLLPTKAWVGPRKQVKVEKPRKNVRLNCWSQGSK